jgi:hypothetical protein
MVLEYRAQWLTSGGAGVSVFHGRGTTGTPPETAAQDLANRVRAFLFEMVNSLPDEVTLSFPDEVLDRNTSTGVLEGLHSVTAPAGFGGNVSGNFAAPAGARVHWNTEAIVSGRRLRGRTFIVPIAAAAYDTNGTLTSTFRTALLGAANTFIDSGVNAWVEASVWSPTHGVQADITSVSVPDEAAILRSRRD